MLKFYSPNVVNLVLPATIHTGFTNYGPVTGGGGFIGGPIIGPPSALVLTVFEEDESSSVVHEAIIMPTIAKTETNMNFFIGICIKN